MLPDVSDALDDWLRPVTVISRTVTTADFVETVTDVSRTQQCVVQVADKSKLNSDSLDWSLQYIDVHSKQSIDIGEIVVFNGVQYKVIERGPWDGYGYTEVIGEQIK